MRSVIVIKAGTTKKRLFCYGSVKFAHLHDWKKPYLWNMKPKEPRSGQPKIALACIILRFNVTHHKSQPSFRYFFTMGSLVFFYASVILCLVGSFLFECLPNFGNVLYHHRDQALCETCTTPAEWSWIVVTSAILFLPNIWRLVGSSSRIKLRHSRANMLLVFVVVNVIWFVLALSRSIMEVKDIVHLMELVGGKAAWPALFNLAVMIFPVKRTSEALDISHKDLTFCHIWAGHATLFWLVVHTVLLSIVYAIHTKSLAGWLHLMVPFDNLYTEGVVNFMGWIGLLSYVLLWSTSLPWFRVRCYEQFRYLHLILSVLFILFSNLHDYNTLHFVQPGFAAWTADLVLRKWSVLITRFDKNNECSSNRDEISNYSGKLYLSTLVTPATSIVCLTFDVPRTWERPLRPGAFIYLKDTSTDALQSHPFSISSFDPSRMTCTVCIKALGDWTTKFVAKAHALTVMSSNEEGILKDQDKSCWSLQEFILEMEGPYGSDLCHTISEYNRCLFIAGGVGLTGVAEAVIQNHNHQYHQTLVWMVRSKEEMDFLVSDILQKLDPVHNRTRVKIFITKKSPPPPPIPAAPEVAMTSKAMKKDHHAQVSSIRMASQSMASITFSDVVAKVASVVAIAVSFLLARMLCCYQSAPPSTMDDDGEWTAHDDPAAYECSLFSYSTTCIHYFSDNNESDPTSSSSSPLPYCTVEICFYGFRALPVVSTLFVTPILLLALALFATWIRRWFHHMTRRYTYSPVDYDTTCSSMMQGEIQADYCTGSRTNDVQPPTPVEEMEYPITVEFKRPTIMEILQDFCHEHNNDTDEPSESGAAGGAAAVVVCGSPSLVESVESEAKKHNRHALLPTLTVFRTEQ